MGFKVLEFKVLDFVGLGFRVLGVTARLLLKVLPKGFRTSEVDSAIHRPC